MPMSTAQGNTETRRYFATVPDNEILPVVNSDYQSNVKGIYVIGDVTGLPLVKIAANQGRDVIEKMDKRGALRAPDRKTEDYDLVIIGGGPAGLSAAAEAQRRGAKYVVLERAKAASTIHGFPPGKKVYAEPRYLKNQSALAVEGDREKSDFLAMVRQVIEEEGLALREETEATQVRRVGDHRFEVNASDGECYPTRNVLVSIGRQGQPRMLDVPGADKSHKVTYRFHTAGDYQDADVLIVGGGNSAVEAALMLREHNRVTLSYRRGAFFRLKDSNQKAIEAAMAREEIEVIFESEVREIRDSEVVLDVAGTPRTMANDHVVVLIGTLPPVPFLLDMNLELDGVWTAKRVAWCAAALVLACLVYFGAKHFTLLRGRAGELVLSGEASFWGWLGSGFSGAAYAGPYHLPGFDWLYTVTPAYFANAYGMYYLLYFSMIAVFGVYWAIRYNNRIVWRRNLANIVSMWTLWWGIPTFLAITLGRNALTPVLSRSLNAWPLNMAAFTIDPRVQPGDPAWWYWAGIVGVLWAMVLTFVLIPLATVFLGKHYCSHICSCGALAETVGNSFRHRSPKGDAPRFIERFGFVFLPLAAVATIAETMGCDGPYTLYNIWVGTLLAGALAIGLYPFLGQRMWCRYWCPLAFWMNFWGRWSRFKISPEPGKCIDCNVCNQYCQMGIDIKSRALQGKPVTLRDTPCVACGECIARCPMEILHFGEAPGNKPYAGGTDAGPDRTKPLSIHDTYDIPKVNELSCRER